MFGASGKSGRGGRGGGGAGGKRKLHSNFHSTSLNRPSGGRSSVGGSSAHRNSRTTTATPATAGGTADPVAADETFSLDTGNPLDFAMIIRLTPDLVDEIKRAESQGGSARIKFDANAYNTTGNVIDVGGKDFRFTWSREMGDLCDIYEERQSGENGNGLLVESGCAWRKLNVQRVLDETTKNQVKMRSEEAERKSKSRKSIILDHGNPSMKSQMKALAAAEANPRKIPFKPAKEPPYKKRKAEPPPGPPKSAQKHESSLTSSKGRFSASPLPSTPEQTHMSLSPFGPSSISRGCTSVDDNMPTQVTNKEKASISEKGTPKRVTATAVLDKPARKGNLVVKPTDLKSMLISLLTDNPRGMSLKALEKSVRENFPNTGRQIEPILKKIATYQAPGRYILNSGAELESLKKPLSESRSAPENNQQQTPGPGNNCDERRNLENSASVKTSTQNNQQQTPDPGDNCDERRNLENSAFVKTPTQNDEPANLNSEPGEVLPEAKKINIPIHSPDHVEKRVCDNSEGLVATSDDSGSDSGSDSESDSSDSESESQSRGRSRSKSKSPVESRSGSSSDSESDASSSSKEGSDEEVDIMTSDDEKEPENKLQAPEHELSTSPIQQRPGDLLVQNATNAKEDLHASEGIEIAETLPGYNGSLSIKYGENHAQVTKSSSGDWAVPNTSQIPTGGLHGERDNGVMDGFRHEDSDISQRKHEGSSTKGSYEKYLDDRAVRSKNVKAGSVSQAPISENSNFLFSGSPGKCSPGRPIEGPYKAHNIQITGKAAKDRADFGLHQQDNQSNPGKAIYDSQLSSPRHVDITGWTNAPSANDRPSKYPENMGSTVKFTERSLQMPEGLLVQKGEGNRDIRSEDGYNNERRPPKNPREGAVDKNATHTDSQNRKRGELAGKIKEVGPVANSQVVYPSKGSNRSDMEGSPINRRGPILRRDPSDLELGELRGSLPEEVPGFKKQFGRNGSFKQFENKLTSFDYWNPDVSKEAAGRTGVDLVKPSQPNSNGGVVGNSEGLSKKRSPKHHKDSTKSQHKVMQSHPPELPRVNQTEVGSQPTDLADVSTKSAHNEAVPSRGTRLEGYGDTQREVMVVTSQLDEAVQGRLYSTRESKRRKTNTSFDLGDRCKDPPLMASRSGGNKKSGSFSDDNNFSYCKYEKDKPELKGPIKDHSQYKEYVQEFREKYDDYFSINKILESERNEFERYGRDLEAAKGKDMNRYYSILEELKESYNQCGMRHKRLKKVFVVLHEELESLKEMIKEYANSCTKV